jgi:hypothetical protein
MAALKSKGVYFVRKRRPHPFVRNLSTPLTQDTRPTQDPTLFGMTT